MLKDNVMLVVILNIFRTGLTTKKLGLHDEKLMNVQLNRSLSCTDLVCFAILLKRILKCKMWKIKDSI